jgi:transposase
LADDDHVVMEATGTYFLKLATFLSAQDISTEAKWRNLMLAKI